jgi:DNA-binding protein HU-beta
MGKSEIVDSIVANVEGLTKKQAGDAFDAVILAISGGINGEGRVALPGFGSFTKANRPQREGRNPSTGEKITITAKNVVKFKAGKALGDSIN